MNPAQTTRAPCINDLASSPVFPAVSTIVQPKKAGKTGDEATNDFNTGLFVALPEQGRLYWSMDDENRAPCWKRARGRGVPL